MKQTISFVAVTAAVLLAAAGASAQSMYDGLNYSDVNNYGTARSMALGNAMTAVGGDLGSIAVNPAGSAVYKYSSFAFSTGFSTGRTTSDYSDVAGSDVFWGSYKDSKSRMTLPSAGFVMHFDTGSKDALRSLTFGVLTNTTNRSLDRMTSMGENSYTSMMGAMAYAADGIDCSNLSSANAWSNYAWTLPLAYNSYMIGEYGGHTDKYLGTTEKEFDDGSIGLAGPIDQKFIMQHTGSRTDLTVNMGANFLDRVFFGVNCNFPMLTYNEDIYARESAVTPSDFQMTLNGVSTEFLDGYQRYYLNTEGQGVNIQAGVIVLPLKWLRLGASIKSPTYYTVTERWGYDAQTNFTVPPGGGNQPHAASPDGEYTYRLESPFEYSLGIAGTLLNTLLVSFDWSGIDYSRMKFRSNEDSFASDEFDDVNAQIRDYAGKTGVRRLGIEWKPVPSLALRYGHEAKRYKTDGNTDKTVRNSFGIGWSSSGSFFADVTGRWSKYPYQWYYPYDDYMYNDSGAVTIRSAEVGYRKRMLDVVLTVGWRF